jgi:hypothetical protein
MRNQEVNQFGLWLQATSHTRRVEKAYDRHLENYDSTRYTKPIPEDWPKQNGAQGKKYFGWKWRATEHGDKSFAKENS